MAATRQRASGLIVPVEVRPPAARCRVCGMEFAHEQLYDGGPYERHVLKCAEEHAQELHDLSIKQRLPGFYGDEAGDPELEHYVRENAPEILEGRKRI